METDIIAPASVPKPKRKTVGFVDLDFGDGTYRFTLHYDHLLELEAKVKCGPLVLFNRLGSGEWFADDVRETIRLGLIGGGMQPITALRMARQYVTDRPDWLGNVQIARVVLMAVLFGIEEAPAGGEAHGEVQQPQPDSGEAGETAA